MSTGRGAMVGAGAITGTGATMGMGSALTFGVEWGGDGTRRVTVSVTVSVMTSLS